MISAAINRYMYIGINRTFTDDYFIKYSDLERCHTVDGSLIPSSERPFVRIRSGRLSSWLALRTFRPGRGWALPGRYRWAPLRAVLRAFSREPIAPRDLAESV